MSFVKFSHAIACLFVFSATVVLNPLAVAAQDAAKQMATGVVYLDATWSKIWSA